MSEQAAAAAGASRALLARHVRDIASVLEAGEMDPKHVAWALDGIARAVATLPPGPASCPGHVGRGPGKVCALCGNKIPPELRRDRDDPSEDRPDCADCQAMRLHVHPRPSPTLRTS